MTRCELCGNTKGTFEKSERTGWRWLCCSHQPKLGSLIDRTVERKEGTMQEDERVTRALVLLAQALDIDPAAMMVAGSMTEQGYMLHVLIVPDCDSDSESEAMADMRAKVEGVFDD